MYRKLLLASCALLAAMHAAPAQVCAPFMPQSNTTRPTPPGRVVYEMETTDKNDNIVTELYLYDFASSNVPVNIPTDTWGLVQAFNPVFSPDGKAIVFSALNTKNFRDLYYWPIGSANPPMDITASMNNQVSFQRDEDVKFSRDGHQMVWKQQFGIATANFALDMNGNPVLTNHKRILGGTDGGSTEASGPVFSPTAKYIYYFTGVQGDQRVHIYDTTHPANPTGTIAHSNGYSIYYPAAPDFYDLIYVGYPNASQINKIYMFITLEQKSYIWNASDCTADNSDPAPVDEDFFIYSRSHNSDSTRFELYFGQWSTGFSWSMANLGVNLASGDIKAANYSTAR